MNPIDYYRIFNLSVNLICIAGIDGYFKYVNPAWENVLGYTRDELLSRPFLDFIHPHDHAKNDEEVAKLASGRLTFDFENRYIHKDGSIRFISWTATPVADEKRIYCIGKDVTEHRQAEEFLKQREAFLSSLIDAIPIPVFYKNRSGQYLGCNEAFESFFGESREQLIGKSVFDISPRQLAEIYHAKDEELFVSGGKQRYESQVKNVNGEFRDVIFNKSVFKDNKDSIVGLIGAILDITERKKADDALKQNENRYKSAQRMGRVGNWEYDLSTEIFWGSDEAKRIYGFDPENKNFTTDEVENCIPDRERIHQALVNLIEKGEPYDLEFEIRPITGPDKKIIKSIAEVIKNDSGIPTKVVGVIQDITDRRLADEWLRKSEEKYRTLLKTTSEGFWLLNPERKTVEVNEALCKMLGYTQTEMCGKSPFDFVDDENRKIFIEQTSKIYTTGHRSYEITLRTKKGNPLHTHFNATTLKDELGQIQGSFALITDITKNKRMAEVLRESEEKYRSMMEAMEDPIYICSHNLRVEYLNPAMIRSLGHDATGESCSQAIYSLDKQCPWCVHEKIQKGESVFTEMLNPKDGHTYHASHTPIFHADNSISKMTIFRDITQRKHLEEEREKLINELQNALTEIKTLSGLLPICAYCKKIRDDKGYWNQIEAYIAEHSDAKFSHSICQECAKKYYPGMDLYDDNGKVTQD